MILQLAGAAFFCIAAFETLVVAGLYLYKPIMGLALTIILVSLQVQTELSLAGTNFRISTTEFLLAVLLAITGVNMVRARSPLKFNTMLWLGLGFIAVALMGLYGADNPFFGLRKLLQIAEGLIFYYVVYRVAYNSGSPSNVRPLIIGALLAGLGVSIFTLYQWYRPELVVQTGGIPLNESGRLRPYGTFGHPNSLGGFLAFLAAVGTTLFMGLKGYRRLAVLAGVGFLVAGLAVAGAKGALLGLAAAVLLSTGVIVIRAGIGGGRWWAALFVIAFIAISALGMIWAGRSVENFFNPAYRNNAARLEIWRASYEVVKSRPIFGVGYYNVGSTISGSVPFKPPHAHNLYLELAAGTGLIGLGFFLAALVVLFRELRFLIRVKDPWVSTVSLGVAAAVASALVQGMVDFLLWDNRYVVGLAVFPALTGAWYRMCTEEDWSMRRAT